MWSITELSSECSAMGMGQFPICKLKWDLLRTSITACTIDKNTFSAPFGIFYVRMEVWKEIFQKKDVHTPNGVLLIFKLPFLNGSFRNGVCKHFGPCILSMILANNALRFMVIDMSKDICSKFTSFRLETSCPDLQLSQSYLDFFGVWYMLKRWSLQDPMVGDG